MDPHEIDQLRLDNQRLRMLVEEARESRDQADAKAKEAVQAEMAELRKIIAAARAKLGELWASKTYMALAELGVILSQNTPSPE